jgi:hypothetical protein
MTTHMVSLNIILEKAFAAQRRLKYIKDTNYPFDNDEKDDISKALFHTERLIKSVQKKFNYIEGSADKTQPRPKFGPPYERF